MDSGVNICNRLAFPPKSVVFGGFRQTRHDSFVTLSKGLNLSELPTPL